VEDHVRPSPAQTGHQIGQVTIGSQGDRLVARPQGQLNQVVVVGASDSQAAGQLLSLLYEELRKLAATKLAQENRDAR
jgi:hypothetical protein